MRALARATFHLRDARVFAGRRASRARSTIVDAASDGGGGVRFSARRARFTGGEPSRLDASRRTLTMRQRRARAWRRRSRREW